jgi:hypothetical protein
VNTPDEVRTALGDLARSKPDVVKIIFDWAARKNTMSLAIMRSLVETSRELNLKTVVHIGTWANARLAAEAGVTAITHFNDTAPVPEDVARLFAARSVVFIPTMAVQEDFLNILEDRTLLDNALLRSVTSDALLDLYRQMEGVTGWDCFTCKWQREGRKHYATSLRRLRDAGVIIVAGSDTGNIGTFQGFSLHRELILLNRRDYASLSLPRPRHGIRTRRRCNAAGPRRITDREYRQYAVDRTNTVSWQMGGSRGAGGQALARSPDAMK